MLTELTTLKSRLALDLLDPTFDSLLLRAIQAISGRFDRETNRTLARTVDTKQEFRANDLEVLVACYPIETVTRFELKLSEAGGWVEQTGVEYLIRNGCILSLAAPLAGLQPWPRALQQGQARVTYTGGYLLPGSGPVPGATPLPPDLEQAAVEQSAFWFQTRSDLGVLRQWPQGGPYRQFADLDLLPSVRQTLGRYARYA